MVVSSAHAFLIMLLEITRWTWYNQRFSSKIYRLDCFLYSWQKVHRCVLEYSLSLTKTMY